MASTMRCSKRPYERWRGDDRAGLVPESSHARIPLRPRRVRACAMLLTLLLLAGCSLLAEQIPGTLAVRDARFDLLAGDAQLDLDLDCRLSGPMQDALEHGIPITLQIDVHAGRWPNRLAQAAPRIELRYFPLSRRYQLREVGNGEVRSFVTSAHLLAALGSLRLSLPSAFAALPSATPLHVAAAIDPAALPGALRLPALFEPAWRLAATETTWPRAAR